MSKTIRELLVINDPSLLYVLLQEQRLLIFSQLLVHEGTALSLAPVLGISAREAHSHLQKLSEVGLAVPAGQPGAQGVWSQPYRAAAARILIDPSLGGLFPASDAAQCVSFVRSQMSKVWRAAAGVGLADLARTMITKMLFVGEGQVILLDGGWETHEFLRELAIEVYCAGAYPITRLTGEELREELLRRVPDRFQGRCERTDVEFFGTVDALISLPSGKVTAPAEGINPDRLAANLDVARRWHNMLQRRRIPTLDVLPPPQPGSLHDPGEEERVAQVYWKTMAEDPERLQARCESVLVRCGKGHGLITDVHGTAMELKLLVGQAFPSDGRIDSRDLAEGRTQDSLPAGRLLLPLQPGLSEGTAYFPYAYCGETRLEGLRVVLKRGKVERWSADAGGDSFSQQLSESGDPSLILGDLVIGLNPAASAGLGSPLDANAPGMITLRFGRNALGSLHSALQLWGHCPAATLALDSVRVIDNGALDQ